MLDDLLVPAIIVAVVLVVLLGAVAAGRRRRPSEWRGPSSGADVAALGRVADVDVDKPAPGAREAPPTVAEPDEPEAASAGPQLEDVGRPTLRERLAKSRSFLATRLADVLGRSVDEETWEDLESALIQADVGVEGATRIVEGLKARARERGVTEPTELRALLADELLAVFDDERGRDLHLAPGEVTVWLVVGVNGTGKTTTIGKLATDLRMHGRNVALAAADTFRAAADEQLGVWAERSGAELVKHQPGADPGAVTFDAYKHASARGVDVLIVDTAGRLHTKVPLMDELAKIRRVIEREGRVHEALLVIDATAGQNGLVQARQFAETAGVTGVVLTKLDGTAKGGIALAIEQSLGIPIKLVGVGERAEDVEPFDPKTYVDALLA